MPRKRRRGTGAHGSGVLADVAKATLRRVAPFVAKLLARGLRRKKAPRRRQRGGRGRGRGLRPTGSGMFVEPIRGVGKGVSVLLPQGVRGGRRVQGQGLRRAGERRGGQGRRLTAAQKKTLQAIL